MQKETPFSNVSEAALSNAVPHDFNGCLTKKLQQFEDSNKMQKPSPSWYEADYSSSTVCQKREMCEKVQNFCFDCFEKLRNTQNFSSGI